MLVTCLGMVACGAQSFKHSVEVIVVDPTMRLGPAPIDVSVFDPRMGSTSDWAKRWMGPTSDGAPYKVPYAATAAATAFGPPRPDRVDLGLAVPKYDSRGFFYVILEPGTARSSTVHAGFTPYDDDFPKDQVPRLDIEYTATPAREGWDFVLRVLVPPSAGRP
jgi:hypothetical protein